MDHALLIVVTRYDLQMGHRVSRDAQVQVFLGQAQVDVDAIVVDLENLLEDRDRLEVKALLGVRVSDGQVGLDSHITLVDPYEQVTLLEERAHIGRILDQDLLVFLDRFPDLALLDEFEGGVVDLVLVDRQIQPSPKPF